MLKEAPMPWANRFGGPGQYFGFQFNFGIKIRVTNCPRGLMVGPVVTLARNPYVKGIKTHIWSNATIAKLMQTTPPATNLAEYSFTGLGNLKRACTHPCYANSATNTKAGESFFANNQSKNSLTRLE